MPNLKKGIAKRFLHTRLRNTTLWLCSSIVMTSLSGSMCLGNELIQATPDKALAADTSLSPNQNPDQAKLNPQMSFTPPPGWRSGETKDLPPAVLAMVIGEGQNAYPPSINLAVEEYNGTTSSYLKIVKEINIKSGTKLKDLGMIHTSAGEASLSQVDVPTKWGETRLMHAILVKQGYAYIMTASALKAEFPKFYKDFFAAMRSLRTLPQKDS